MLRDLPWCPLALALACHAAPSAPRDTASVPAMPGPTTAAPAPDRVALNDGCVRCHAPQAAEWEASQHRSAYADPDFLHAVATERGPFCRGCHAPEADPARVPAQAEGTIGVACVTCHVPHGSDASMLAEGTLAATTPTRATPAPHPVTRTAAFADVDACGGCHEFAFPRTPALAMQSTLTEHAASRFAATPCAECHMPWVDSSVGSPSDGAARHRSHAFAASRDPAMLRAAIDVQAVREPGGRVSLRLTPGRIGHAFPTGDLFRRLWVDVQAQDEDGDEVAYDARALTRHFAGPGGPITHDDRPGATALRDGIVDVAFELGAAVDEHPIAWRVVHQRVALPHDGDDAEIFGEIVVTEGRLDAAGATP